MPPPPAPGRRPAFVETSSPPFASRSNPSREHKPWVSAGWRVPRRRWRRGVLRRRLRVTLRRVALRRVALRRVALRRVALRRVALRRVAVPVAVPACRWPRLPGHGPLRLAPLHEEHDGDHQGDDEAEDGGENAEDDAPHDRSQGVVLAYGQVAVASARAHAVEGDLVLPRLVEVEGLEGGGGV